MLLFCLAFAQDIVLDGPVPDDGLDHFFVEFEVPAGTAEVQVHLDDQSESVILDWGVNDPNGHRGWGGGNSEPAIIGELASSRSYTTGPIPAGTWSVVVGKARVNEPASYHVEITTRTAATLPPEPERTPYTPSPPLSDEARWYKGDFHVHSEQSGDASASLDDIADFARDRGLDFVVITDHNIVAQLELFADAQARHPDILFVPGVEFTTYNGHANGIGSTEWVDHKLGQPGVTLEGAVQSFHDQGALFSINHPSLDLSTCIGCAWGHEEIDPSKVDAVEIATGGWTEGSSLFTPRAIEFWDELVAAGATAAALGGSDDHRAGVDLGLFQSPIGSPTTAIYASDLSVSSLLQGIREQRTYVQLQGADDPDLEVTHDGTQEEHLVQNSTGEALTLTATVRNGDGQSLVWIRGGEVVQTSSVAGEVFEDTFLIDTLDEDTPVRAELRLASDPTVVSSYVFPVLVHAEDQDSGEKEPAADGKSGGGGCGCATDSTGWAWPLAWRRR